MRNIILILLLIAFSSSYAQKVKWYSFEEAVELNKTKPKKILVDVYTDWCGWCKKMDQNTFSHPVIAEYINKNFYAVKFDAESKEAIKFKEYTD